MKKIYLFLFFLLINFGGLAIGNWFMGDAVDTSWYTNLEKAPWTPPRWVFGVSWTLIMICFSIYLSYLFALRNSPYVIAIYVFAFVLNVSWNPIFFKYHLSTLALGVIAFLTLVIVYFFISFGDDKLSKIRYLLLPYIIWLFIATSLNAYIVFYN